MSLDKHTEFIEYQGAFENDLYQGMGVLWLRSGLILKGNFENGKPKEGLVDYPNG